MRSVFNLMWMLLKAMFMKRKVTKTKSNTGSGTTNKTVVHIPDSYREVKHFSRPHNNRKRTAGRPPVQKVGQKTIFHQV